MHKNDLDSPIEYLKGVGPKKGALLKTELNIHTFENLLTHYPFRYVDRSRFYKINEITPDLQYIQLKGKIISFNTIGEKRSKRLTALFKDETGTTELIWFQGIRWILAALKTDTEYIVFGKPNSFKGKLNFSHPEVDLVSEENLQTNSLLQAVYSSSEKLSSCGLNSKGIGKLLNTLIQQINQEIHENLPEKILNDLNFPSRESALKEIHFPQNQESLKKAIERLKFEELFFIQLRILKLKIKRDKSFRGFPFIHVGNYFNNFYHNILSFELTYAQKRVIKEIRKDLGSGKQMNRLLQGDVGSGKTIVALMCILIALDNGYQAALMSPTEILANQLFEGISSMLNKMDIETAILTGSTKTAERRKIFERISNGEVKILIGTHAILEDKVQFKNLGFAVIDEQHKFGVEQRAGLWKKNISPPHVLVMTATPIPRTLAMTLYGDLEVSVIDELPPGRKPVKTIHRFDSSRLRVFGFMKEQIKHGRQIYVVYPLIRESEIMDYKDLNDGLDSIERDFPAPDYHVSVVHGKMKPADKDFEMKRFVKGQTNIMVATNVIEVGVDIPNATVMVIESAERFGLSQLHQLRGRVGRGAEQSYCIMMTGEKLSEAGKIRMKTMENTTDGFEIAETDMRLRGPGDIEGTIQSGIIDLKLADLGKDAKILESARTAAKKLLEKDPELILPENAQPANHYAYMNRNRKEWGRIS